jgi:photosystem II stability/assembly factor-like uncharacterized protein
MSSKYRKPLSWTAIFILSLPALVLYAFSLRYRGFKGKGDEAFVIARVHGAPAAEAPWVMQDSGTTAGLRGIYSVDGKVAWASGTGGTVLRTVDGGEHWTKCAVPDGEKDGATLDFRGVQAWDEKTAIVMASGPGDKSRLYRTKDGCKKWSLVLKNRDKGGFWDAIHFAGSNGWIFGDPVDGKWTLLFVISNNGDWYPIKSKSLSVAQGTQGAFAASNTSMAEGMGLFLATGGTGGAQVLRPTMSSVCLDDCSEKDLVDDERKSEWEPATVPVGVNSESSGIFSLALRLPASGRPMLETKLVAVGGDYVKPNDSEGTSAWSEDDGKHWVAAKTPPHGYRSSVVWSEEMKAWITVGTNGSDISRDDGKTWAPLDDGNWNALSLPFVVGPKGRIARLAISSTK